MNGLRDKIPVEPLDEARYERLEYRVMAAYEGISLDVAEPASPGRRCYRSVVRATRWVGPGLAVAAVVLLAYISLRGAPERESLSSAAGDSAPVRLVTDRVGETTYHVGNAEIVVAPSSALEIRREPVVDADSRSSRAGAAIRVDLLAGTIDCDVEPIVDRPPFAVHAGDVAVTVVGTAFRVEYDGATVRVSVTRGQVQVADSAGTRLLGAGESWASQAQLAAAPAGSSERNDSGQGFVSAAVHSDSTHTAFDTDSEARLGSRRSTAPGSAGQVPDVGLGQRSATRPATPAKTARSKRARSKRSGRKATGGKRAGGALTDSKERRALKRARPARGTAPAGHRDIAEILANEVDDPRAAIDAYGKVALGRGAAAEFALYSVAYLQAMKLGQRSKALATLRHYQRRFARGKHRESALWLRIRLLCAGSDRNVCRAAAHSYLKSFPDGDHADLAGQIIHWDM